MDQFGLVQPVDSLGQRVVVAVTTTSNRGLDPGLGQPFGVADADVLRAPVRVVNERIAIGLPGVESLLQGIENVRADRILTTRAD